MTERAAVPCEVPLNFWRENINAKCTPCRSQLAIQRERLARQQTRALDVEERTGGGREGENTTDNEIPVRLPITHTDQRASRGRAGALARRLQSAGIAARQRDNDEGRPSRGERASAFHCVSYMLSNDRERNYSFGGGGGGGMASCLHTYYAYVARTDYILVCTYSHAGPT